VRHSPLLTILLLAAVLLLAATVSRAEDFRPGSVPPEAQVEHFLSGLSSRVALTPAETASVRPILLEQARKRQALVRARMGSGKPGAAGMLALRDDLRALAKETDGKLAAVLPPSKMAAMRAYTEERRKEAVAKLAARRGG
jgi:hypothetical protein